MGRGMEDCGPEMTAPELIRAAAGEDGLARLCDVFGGTGLKIPACTPIRPDHPLVVTVGQAAADAIARELGGAYVHFPNSAATRARIFQAREAGMSVRQIARLVNRTMRHVYQVLREGPHEPQRRDDRQLAMFD